jgi:uncharacterized protein YndB with AHSA1/START domain
MSVPEASGRKENFIAKASIEIEARVAAVWKALVDPEMIKKYLFGTEATSDWKIGSAITYKGIWQGKPYEDKGKILELVPNQLLKSTYWSDMSGLEDKPENYSTVAYSLSEKDGKTILVVSQDNNASKESAAHSESNWGTVLKGLKEIVEKQ